MSPKIIQRQVGDVTVLDCVGRIVLGEGANILRETVHCCVTEGNQKLLLNLASVTYMDGTGIGELVSAYTFIKNIGGDLKLLNPQERINRAFQITRLDFFDVIDDETQAIASFA